MVRRRGFSVPNKSPCREALGRMATGVSPPPILPLLLLLLPVKGIVGGWIE